MKIDSRKYRVKAGERVKLKKWPTLVAPAYGSRDEYQAILEQHVHELRQRQELLYAYNRYALLVIFQAMDAAGKDGAINHVMSGVNPQGCQVFSFKHPGPTELDHDFLWRAAQRLPERGRIGIFNRSYYEEVLIARVHPDILRSEKLPQHEDGDGTVWKERFRSIVDFERHLDRNGTRVVKIFLHLSAEEQRKRFLARIDDPQKNWKLNLADMQERACWDDYMRAYEACLSHTSTKLAPWYVVPADDKENARLLISQIVLDALKDLKMRYPEPDTQQRREIAQMRRKLLAQAPEDS